MVWQLEPLTAPVVELRARHPVVHTEPLQSCLELQPTRDERVVSKLRQLGLEVRAVSPPAEIKDISSVSSGGTFPYILCSR